MTPLTALLQVAPDTTARIAALETAVKNAQSAGDNAWMLTSAALVLMMTGPGLALFYGGLVRRKNVLSTMMHSFIMMGIITVLWAFVGYSLVFSEGSPFIGGLKYAFLNGVGSEPNADYAATIPQGTYMIYQLMFAIITPALISGAYAERIKFSAMSLFTTLWAFVVYFPMAHMVWGKGGFLNAYLGGKFHTFDFAGGTVVHITSGVSALVCALVPGQARRVSEGADEAAQHDAQRNRRMSLMGGLVWIQRGERDSGKRTRHERLHKHSFRGRQRGFGLDGSRVDEIGKTQHAGRYFRCGGWFGCDYAGVRLRAADARAVDWTAGRHVLLSDGHGSQAYVRL